MSQIEIVKGNVVNANAEIIVNSANSSLRPGLGVNKAVFYACGKDLEKECRELNVTVPIGKAVMTDAYNAAADYVIHTVGPYWYGGYEREARQLASCYIECMKLAETQKCRSIAFPSLCTGRGEYPLEEAAEIAIGTIKSYIKMHDLKIQVQFLCYDTDTLIAYRTANAKKFLDISKYLKRNKYIYLDEDFTAKEKALFKKKNIRSQYAAVKSVAERVDKDEKIHLIFLPFVRGEITITEDIHKEYGARGPFVTPHCITDVKCNGNAISCIIRPIFLPVTKEEIPLEINNTRERFVRPEDEETVVFNVEEELKKDIFVDEIISSDDDIDYNEEIDEVNTENTNSPALSGKNKNSSRNKKPAHRTTTLSMGNESELFGMVSEESAEEAREKEKAIKEAMEKKKEREKQKALEKLKMENEKSDFDSKETLSETLEQDIFMEDEFDSVFDEITPVGREEENFDEKQSEKSSTADDITNNTEDNTKTENFYSVDDLFNSEENKKPVKNNKKKNKSKSEKGFLSIFRRKDTNEEDSYEDGDFIKEDNTENFITDDEEYSETEKKESELYIAENNTEEKSNYGSNLKELNDKKQKEIMDTEYSDTDFIKFPIYESFENGDIMLQSETDEFSKLSGPEKQLTNNIRTEEKNISSEEFTEKENLFDGSSDIDEKDYSIDNIETPDSNITRDVFNINNNNINEYSDKDSDEYDDELDDSSVNLFDFNFN